MKITILRISASLFLYTGLGLVYGQSGTYDDKASYLKDQLRWSSSQLRELWDEAGVHIYLNTGEVFYIGRGWMCVHSVTGGERVVKLPFYARVMDPSNDQVVAESTNSIELNLSPKSTILLRISPFDTCPIPIKNFIP